jgi:phosphatidylserine/phosphatidylglycerophosphate/cardiolipin synthase-like enzyme
MMRMPFRSYQTGLFFGGQGHCYVARPRLKIYHFPPACHRRRIEEENKLLTDVLPNMDIPGFIDDKPASAHNKIMIIDNRVVISGSVNFTRAAENQNAENLMILEGLTDLTRTYRENFQKHLRPAGS